MGRFAYRTGEFLFKIHRSVARVVVQRSRLRRKSVLRKGCLLFYDTAILAGMADKSPWSGDHGGSFHLSVLGGLGRSFYVVDPHRHRA